MAVSQNGWQVPTPGALRVLPWITGSVRAGDVWTVLDYLCRRFHTEVEPITAAWSWGYAYRQVRAGTDLSNHASGTAVDLNAPRHPLAKRGTFTVAQRTAIRGILADLRGVIRWGGDYTGRADEMHFEVVASAARVADVAARIRAGTVAVSHTTSTTPTVTVPNLAPAPAPLTPVLEDDMKDILTALYLKTLGRLPDAAGFATYVPAVATGKMTWADVERALEAHPESAAFAALGSEEARNAARVASGWEA